MNQLCRFIKESRKCFKITFGGFEHFTTNGDEIKNIYNVIMEEYIITIEQLEIYHRNILDKNSEDCNTGFAKQNLVLNGDFVPVHLKSEAFQTEVNLHKILQTRVTILLDDCPIKIIRIIPFDYTSNDGAIKEKLYMLQFVYNDEINTAMIHQLTLTHDGYGFSCKGPKHRFDIGVFYADPS